MTRRGCGVCGLSEGHSAKCPNGEVAVLDQVVTFGKYSGQTWREILERDANYAGWVVENVDRLPFATREALSAALGEIDL